MIPTWASCRVFPVCFSSYCNIHRISPNVNPLRHSDLIPILPRGRTKLIQIAHTFGIHQCISQVLKKLPLPRVKATDFPLLPVPRMKREGANFVEAGMKRRDVFSHNVIYVGLHQMSTRPVKYGASGFLGFT